MKRLRHKEYAPLSDAERARLEASIALVARVFAPVHKPDDEPAKVSV